MTRMRQRRTTISLPSLALSSPRRWPRPKRSRATNGIASLSRQPHGTQHAPPYSYIRGAPRFRSLFLRQRSRHDQWNPSQPIQERSLESARHLRDPAQQCYLLIGLTDDAQVKSHFLDLGLALERQVGLIEGGTAGGAPPRLTAVTAPAAAPAQASPRAVARVPRAGAHTPREPPPPRDCRSIWQDASSAAPARAVPL